MFILFGPGTTTTPGGYAMISHKINRIFTLMVLTVTLLATLAASAQPSGRSCQCQQTRAGTVPGAFSCRTIPVLAQSGFHAVHPVPARQKPALDQAFCLQPAAVDRERRGWFWTSRLRVNTSFHEATTARIIAELKGRNINQRGGGSGVV